MATALQRRLQSTDTLPIAGLAFLFGLGLHAVDQALYTRAGPIPILLTAPVVATLVYLDREDLPTGRIAALLAWGALSSGLAVVGLYLQVVNDVLPRPLTGTEMVAYDAGMFLWFVLVLAVIYAVAARMTGSKRVGVLLLGPIAQASFGVIMTALVASGAYA